MRSSHGPATTFAAFDDGNLLTHGGLGPAVRLAELCGLPGLVREKVLPTERRSGQDGFTRLFTALHAPPRPA
ncbi:hypothetical protein [Streptomyces sp. TE5632]